MLVNADTCLSPLTLCVFCVRGCVHQTFRPQVRLICTLLTQRGGQITQLRGEVPSRLQELGSRHCRRLS